MKPQANYQRLVQRIRSLPAGIYTALSTDPAYAQLRAAVARGAAVPLFERSVRGGAKELTVHVGLARRNAVSAPGAWRETEWKFTPRYFDNMRRDYGRFEEAWWREVIQNAVDNGATRVILGHKNEADGTHTVWCQDNGTGMSVDTFENVFLALGATTKELEGGQRGGFGKAREVLLLPWLLWEVSSNEFEAKGQALGGPDGAPRPIIREVPPQHGTLVRVRMPSDHFTDHSYSEAYIRKCFLPGVDFTLVSITSDNIATEKNVPADFMPPGEIIGDVPGLCTFRFVKHPEMRGFFYRLTGQYLFRLPANAEADGCVLADIKLTDKAQLFEILTSNRDSIKDSPLGNLIREKQSTISSRLATDAMSAQKAKKRGLLHEIKVPSPMSHEEAFAKVMEAMPPLPVIEDEDSGAVLSPEHVDLVLNACGEMFWPLNPSDPRFISACHGGWAREALRTLYIRGQNQFETAMRHLTWQPPVCIYTMESSEYAKGGWEAFEPQRLTDRGTSSLKLWTEVCRLVLMHLNEFEPWGVGVYLGEAYDQTVAATLRDYEERFWLLINPFNDDSIMRAYTKPMHWRSLVTTAVHEATHFVDGFIRGSVRGHRVEEYELGGHDETFASALGRNTALASPVFQAERFSLVEAQEIERAVPRKEDAQQILLKHAQAFAWLLFEYPGLVALPPENRLNRVNRSIRTFTQYIWRVVYVLNGEKLEETPEPNTDFEGYVYTVLCGTTDISKIVQNDILRVIAPNGCCLEMFSEHQGRSYVEATMYPGDLWPGLTPQRWNEIAAAMKPDEARRIFLNWEPAKLVTSDIFSNGIEALTHLEEALQAPGKAYSREKYRKVNDYLDALFRFLQVYRVDNTWPKVQEEYATEHLLGHGSMTFGFDQWFDLSIDPYGIPIKWFITTQSPELLYLWRAMAKWVKRRGHLYRWGDREPAAVSEPQFRPAREQALR